MRMRLARQFMHDELLRPRTYYSRTLTIRNPAFDSQTLSTYSAFFHLPPPSSSLSPGRLRSVFGVLIIIHRATTVAQRLLLADYTSGRSRNRSIVCSLKHCFRLYRIACACAQACTHAWIRNNCFCHQEVNHFKEF